MGQLVKVEGVVEEALPNALFRVITGDGRSIRAVLSGKMRYNKIRILVGDKVAVEEDPTGGVSRLVRRL